MLFGVLATPHHDFVSAVLLFLFIPPWLAVKLQGYAVRGRGDDKGRAFSPFLPRGATERILREAVKPWDGLSWADLKDQLWKYNQSPVSLPGFRDVTVEGGVCPAGFTFGGANQMLVQMLTAEVGNGAPITVAATLKARHERFPWIELVARERTDVARGTP